MRTTTITVRVDLALVGQLDALAERLTASPGVVRDLGKPITRTAAARLALRRGMAALREAESRTARRAPGPKAIAHLPDIATLNDATEALEQLAALDLGGLDLGVLGALGDLDVEVLRALGRLDASAIDALDQLPDLVERLDEVC